MISNSNPTFLGLLLNNLSTMCHSELRKLMNFRMISILSPSSYHCSVSKFAHRRSRTLSQRTRLQIIILRPFPAPDLVKNVAGVLTCLLFLCMTIYLPSFPAGSSCASAKFKISSMSECGRNVKNTRLSLDIIQLRLWSLIANCRSLLPVVGIAARAVV